MIESSTFSLVLQLLACLVLGTLYAWFLYRKDAILSLKEKRILALIRACLVAGIASLLIFPLVKSVSYSLEKPVIVIAHDNSSSILNKWGSESDYNSYSSALKALSKGLAAKFEVLNFSFGDSVTRDLRFTGNDLVTDANKFAIQLNAELQNRNVGALILASDGIFNRGGNPQYELSKLNAPIFPIALGNTEEPKDLLLSNLNHNDVAFLGNQFTVEVLIQGYKVRGEQIKVSIYEEGTIIKEEVFEADVDDIAKEISFTIPASKVGLRKYTVQLSKLDGELTYKNNIQAFFVDVVEQKQSILIAASVPHPDISALKNTIQNFNQYQVDVVLADGLAAVNLAKYGVIVLHQLPSKSHSANQFISKLKLTEIPTWHIVGVNSDLGGFNDLQDVVNLSSSGARNQFVSPLLQNNFSLFQLDEALNSKLSNVGPFQNSISTVNLKLPVDRLFDQKVGNQNTDRPLWFFSDLNGNRSAFLLGEGLWTWYLQSDASQKDQNNNDLSTLVSNTLQYLSLTQNKERFKISPSKKSYDSFESVVLNARLLNENYEVINTPELRLELRDNQNRIFNYSFTRTAQTYKLELGKLSPGDYSFKGEVEHGGRKLLSSGKFYVTESLLEYQQLSANHDLLQSLAASTGGKVIGPTEIGSLLSTLENSDALKTISYEDKRFKEVINYKWLFFLILLVLTVEWVYRKRMGAL